MKQIQKKMWAVTRRAWSKEIYSQFLLERQDVAISMMDILILVNVKDTTQRSLYNVYLRFGGIPPPIL